MGIGARVCQLMGIVTEVHLLKIFGEQGWGEMKNVLVRLIQEKNWIPFKGRESGGIWFPWAKVVSC